MKLTNRQRDEAVMICAIAASNRDEVGQSYGAVCNEIGLSRGTAFVAALCAWGALPLIVGNGDAEAAALLEGGWSPGDPIRRLR